MKIFLSISICIFYVILLPAQDKNFALKEGDLLFQQTDCGAFCEAIYKVTEGIEGLDFSHVGILTKDSLQRWQVLEAISIGVVKTPLDSFLYRSVDHHGRPKVVVGRVKNSANFSITKALNHESQFLGKAYDEVFDINNELYYCSELVYFLYRDQRGNPLFSLKPMTFIDPDTETTFSIWEDYYEKLDQPIPEGKPGLNPGGISRSDKLTIFYPYSGFNLK